MERTRKRLVLQRRRMYSEAGTGFAEAVLERIPRKQDEDLLVGFESSDDAAVYRLSPELAVVHTLDFFPPVVEDPELYGQIAAANALSDIYAMGAEVRTALNIVCFPEKEDLNLLGKVIQGGAQKVEEAGGHLGGRAFHFGQRDQVWAFRYRNRTSR